MFDLGQVLITSGIQYSDINPFTYLERFRDGDWGDTCDEDKKLNDSAVKDGGRIVAKYLPEDDEPIFIITEWDRSCTTILLCSEY